MSQLDLLSEHFLLDQKRASSREGFTQKLTDRTVPMSGTQELASMIEREVMACHKNEVVAEQTLMTIFSSAVDGFRYARKYKEGSRRAFSEDIRGLQIHWLWKLL